MIDVLTSEGAKTVLVASDSSETDITSEVVTRLDTPLSLFLFLAWLHSMFIITRSIFSVTVIIIQVLASVSPSSSQLKKQHGMALLEHPALRGHHGDRHRNSNLIPIHPGEFGLQALANLTDFRKSLKHEVLGNAKWGYGKTGHERFDMYPPVVTCPPGERDS